MLQRQANSRNRPTATEKKKVFSFGCDFSGWYNFGKIIKTVATRCHILKLNHQIWFRLGLRPKPRWGSLQRSPRPSSQIYGDLLLKGRRGRVGKGLGEKGGWCRHSLAQPTFSLVYATPLLQHQGQFGLHPAVSRLRAYVQAAL